MKGPKRSSRCPTRSRPKGPRSDGIGEQPRPIFSPGTGCPEGHRGLDPRNREIDLAPLPDEPSLLTLIIELRGSKPRIWRRLSLPGDLTLDVVHTLFQGAMGWTDSHLHRFQPGIGQGYNQPYFVTESDEEEGTRALARTASGWIRFSARRGIG